MRDELIQLRSEDPRAFVEAFLESIGTAPWAVGDHYENASYRRLELDADGFSLALVHSVGGDEGEGERVVRVFLISDHHGPTADVYFRVTGHYTSYDGTEWDRTFDIVVPRQVMVTQYFTE
jgi:hypothetical protein